MLKKKLSSSMSHEALILFILVPYDVILLSLMCISQFYIEIQFSLKWTQEYFVSL